LCNGCSDIPPFLNVFSYTHAFAMNMYHCNLQAINQSKKLRTVESWRSWQSKQKQNHA